MHIGVVGGDIAPAAQPEHAAANDDDEDSSHRDDSEGRAAEARLPGRDRFQRIFYRSGRRCYAGSLIGAPFAAVVCGGCGPVDVGRTVSIEVSAISSSMSLIPPSG